MKGKKDAFKLKKKKTKLESVAGNDSAIRKAKKVKKIKKIASNSEVAAVVKEEFVVPQCKEMLCKRIPSRQQIWNQYLKTFYEIEKLNQDQKQIMEFCLNKSLTPPKRKRRFLNFIRNCFVKQAEMSDEQINELFDLLLKKYDEYKSGTYCIPDTGNHVSETESCLKSRKKERKLLYRTSNANPESSTKMENQSAPVKDEEKWERTKSRKRKRARAVKLEITSHDEQMSK